MNKRTASDQIAGLLFGLLLLVSNSAWAQRPQDNWYLEATWNKGAEGMTLTNGGLSAPYGVAIGPDGRIYVGDGGYSCIQVYLPDGSYSFSITNGFGGGESFSQPRGMITEKAGNLYVADYGQNAVFVFDGNGGFLRKIGGTTGTGDGELSGPIDVGVGSDGQVYVLENLNARVSVFAKDGTFLRKWGGYGMLDGQLINPRSMAVLSDGRLRICSYEAGLVHQNLKWGASIKDFDTDGIWLRSGSNERILLGGWMNLAGIGGSVRNDPGGYSFTVVSVINCYPAEPVQVVLYAPDGVELSAFPLSQISVPMDELKSPCHAFGLDGTFVLCGTSARTLWRFRFAFREQPPIPRNAIPIPGVTRIRQRPSTPLVDVDYVVTDADNAKVHTAMLAYKNDYECLSNCISRLTFAEGTATNLGPNIAANQSHRVTWNAGADWSVSLGTFHVSVLAMDNRPNLLDIHYLRLREGNGLPALKISRSPLIQSDFMQVWWWLLATNDVAINLSSNRIYGVSGANNGKVLCEDELTTADGRAYLCEKMRLREATADEVQRARRATLPAGATPNQWTPVRSVGGRPAAVNEYGFDTGDWGSEAYWVVPLN